MLGLVLITAQAFFYNAIFFTYALVLSRFFGVPPESVGLYLLPFAVSNFVGPLALGWLFDQLGTQADDHRDLCGLGCAARGDRMVVRRWRPDCGHPDLRLRRSVLLRVRGGELGIFSRSASHFRSKCARWPSQCSTQSARRWGHRSALDLRQPDRDR